VHSHVDEGLYERMDHRIRLQLNRREEGVPVTDYCLGLLQAGIRYSI